MSAKGFCENESFKRGIKEQDKFLQFISTLKVNNNNIINNSSNNHYSSYNNVVSSRNGSTTSGFDQLEALCALLDERQNRMGDLLGIATTDPPPASMENTSPPTMMMDGTSKDLESSRSLLARRHSLASMEHQPDVEKNRKEKSPWGKVKNIINTRRDSSRKRSCPQEPSWRTKSHSATKERRPRFCQSDDFVGQMPTETKKDNLEASISTYDHLLLPPMDLQFTEESQSLPGSPSRVSTVFFYDDQMFEQEQVLANRKCAVGTKIRARPLAEKKPQEEDLKPEFRLKVAEWEVRKALAGLGTTNIEEIRKLMPDDFNKKLQQWETKKQASCGSSLAEVGSKSSRSPKSQNKKSGNEPMKRATVDSDGDGDLPWIERELRKIQREQENLDLDRAKLQKMRQAIKKPEPWREITVKTSTGEEFRFGGISEKFTRKLYEWEQRKKIPLECSSLALLGSESACKIISDSNTTLPSQGLPRSKSDGSLVDSCSTKTAEEAEGFKDDEIVLPKQLKCHSRFSVDNGGVVLENLCHLPIRLQTSEHSTSTPMISRKCLLRLQIPAKKLTNQIEVLLAQEESTNEGVRVPSTFFETIRQLMSEIKLTTSSVGDLDDGELPWRTCDIVPGWINKHLPSLFKEFGDLEEVGSQVSLSHSMSRYGSESLLNSIDAMAAEGTYANADRKDFVRRRLPRQASSDDLSTPNSGRSRSSSIISSDFIPEECEDDRSNGDVTCGFGGPNGLVNMPSKTDVDIEKVCQLVQDLKEQDLFHHRQRIVEKELRSQESKHYPEVSLGAESHSVPTPKHCGVGIVPTIKTIFNQPEIRVSLKADGNTGWKVAAQSNKVENESETHHEMNTMRQKHQMARESFFGVMMKGEEVCQIANQASTTSKELGNNKQKNSDHLSQPSKSNGTSSPTQGSSSCPTTPIQIRK